MNRAQAAQRVAEVCLAENRPLTEALQAWAPRPAQTAATGDLKKALKQLGYDDRLAALGAVRSVALRPARRLLAEVPGKDALRIPLVQTFLWFGFLAAIQVVVLAVLRAKVFPVMATYFRDYQLPFPSFVDLVELVQLLAFAVLGAGAVYGWLSPAWLPGWGRTLRKAREAAIGSALAETGPSPEVWADWIRGSPVLQKMGAATAADLRALSHEWGRRAEAQLGRFVTAYRFVGFALLVLVALAVLMHVYSASAWLARVQ